MSGLVDRQACPICAVPGQVFFECPYDAPPISTYMDRFYDGRWEPLVGDVYRLRRCDGCGLVYQDRVPTPALLVKIYDDWGVPDREAKQAERKLDVRRFYVRQVDQLVLHFGGDPSRIDVLDYGMGWGMWVDVAVAYGCRVVGAEFPGQQADFMRAKGIPVLAPDELPEEAFDFVNTEQVFEHLVDPLEVARRLWSALKPGGILRISVPNGKDLDRLLEIGDWEAERNGPNSLHLITPLEHLNCFTQRSLVALAGKAGLDLFRYPLRETVTPHVSMRAAAGAVRAAIRPQESTMHLFRKVARAGAATHRPVDSRSAGGQVASVG